MIDFITIYGYLLLVELGIFEPDEQYVEIVGADK
jgi:hypothetical protein